MIVNGTTLVAPPDVTKCQSEFKAVSKKKKIDLDATGDKKTNALLAWLQCHAKSGAKNCKPELKEYTACHQSFMGVGSYKGQKHCGGPMTALYECVTAAAANNEK